MLLHPDPLRGPGAAAALDDRTDVRTRGSALGSSPLGCRVSQRGSAAGETPFPSDRSDALSLQTMEQQSSCAVIISSRSDLFVSWRHCHGVVLGARAAPDAREPLVAQNSGCAKSGRMLQPGGNCFQQTVCQLVYCLDSAAVSWSW